MRFRRRPILVLTATLAVASAGASLASQLREDGVAGASNQLPAQCSTTGAILEVPTGIVQSNTGSLLVAESGTPTPNSGRISIVDLDGSRRTLIDGLPSGISDVGTPNGPSGLFMRGRTLYVAIGTGNVGRNGPIPGTSIPNPNESPSSPIFSSVLALRFSSSTEQTTSGFTLTLDNQFALATDQQVRLSAGRGQEMTIQRVAQLPYWSPKPLPTYQANIDLTNPFAVTGVGDRLYVTDGGQNAVWEIDLSSGSSRKLTEFADIANPLFPAVGGPFEEAVPTGIAYSGGRLLVTLFTGVPFSPGTSSVQSVSVSGSQTTVLAGLKTAIGVLPIHDDGADYLVLENASIGPFFNSPGLVLHSPAPGGTPTVVANCLTRPTAMTLDSRTNTLFVVDLGGHVTAIHINP